MNRPGWNPTRRNRKIGTSDSGWGQDNRLNIPQDWRDSRIFWERLNDPVETSKDLPAGKVTVLVEPTTYGFAHSCTPEDIFAVLDLLPDADISGLSTVVLRQPRRKEVLMSPVWGRFGYWAALAKNSGPAVFLEAQEVGSRLRWKTSMGPETRKELDRLIRDGHRIERTRRHYEWVLDLEACRSTQLYRTLIHEIGHFVDKKRSIDEAVASLESDDPRRGAIIDSYWSKSHEDKETFAHSYAQQVALPLMEQGLIPFPRRLDQEQINSFGGRMEWFVQPAD